MTDGMASTTAVDLSREATSGVLEIALVAILMALALGYLWRTYLGRRRKGCAHCGSARTCQAARSFNRGPGR
ncbi:hypothetical protein [Roseospira navarrensis]|uniref:FeoB-associated Cys-rich membrane protein n=1 Tax=Roseospira navarrensis TaxID=140058 RepID=A0A7X1ZEP2_9PROT|nr:hypothetical protein [Roseospira navarrensis]MQX37184.1 hypothetical protein [Roseospira navarrensis]